MASRRAQSGDRIAFHQDRTGVVKVIALGRFVRDILYDRRSECVPATFGKRARGLGLTPIGRPL